MSDGKRGRRREAAMKEGVGKMFQDDGRRGGGGQEAERSCDPLIRTKTRSLHS